MKKLLLACATSALCIGSAQAEDVKIAVLIGFTGPIETMAPNMANAAEMAINEVNASGKALNGWNFVSVRADTTCADAAAATTAAERVITSDKVAGVMGPDCSGVTRAILANVARANGMAMISPSATGPALSDEPDDGLFFRTASTDALEMQNLAKILVERGVKSIAISYSNSDFGKGQAEQVDAAFKALGGTVTINASHDDGKADYSAEVAALAAAGGDVLLVAGYADQGGKGIIQSALDTGAFSSFALPNGMYADSLTDVFGSQLDGSVGIAPAPAGDGAAVFEALTEKNEPSFAGNSAFAASSYDAAALIMLAMQAANSTDPKVYKDKVIELANGPADGSGEKILAGELGKALELIAAGKAIDYEGASGIKMAENGDMLGSYNEYDVKDGKWALKAQH